MNVSNVLKVSKVRNTPKVLSRMFVLKYQLHAHVDIFDDKSNDIITFIKWANVCDMPCFDVSSAHIFHGLLGF